MSQTNQQPETTSTKKNQPDQLAEMLSVASNSTRLLILRLLFSWESGCVSSIADACDLSVATASYHLNIMADVGYLTRKRDGQKICYHLRDTEFIICLRKLVETVG